MDVKYVTRIKLLKIWEILITYSDKDNPLTTSQIIKKLQAEGIACDRRTLSGDIDVLVDGGYAVHATRGKENAYYADKFSPTGVDALIIAESVKNNPNISVSKTNSLIKNLSGITYDKNFDISSARLQTPFINKTFSADVYKTVELLLKAVASGKKVAFTAFEYGPDKKRVYTKGKGPIVVTPLSVVSYCGRYYLSFFDGKSVCSLPLKKMEKAVITDVNAEKTGMNATTLKNAVISSVCGRVEKVTFIADNGLIGEVLDYFGELTDLYRQGADKVSFTVEVAVNDYLFGWCMSKRGAIRINAPKKTKDLYEKYIKETFSKTF